MNKTSKRSSILALLFTFAVDNLGASIVFPIFAPLFMQESSGLLPAGMDEGTRATLLGFFLGAYPLAQLFLSPLLGNYSDHVGRKKALIITTLSTCFGFTVAALSIDYLNLPFLFIGRVFAGIGAGNLSICMSSLADISHTGKEKRHYFSIGSAIAGLTFVLGPFIGGKLSDPSISSYFHPSFPMWVGAILSFINLLFIVFGFRETLKERIEHGFDLLKGFRVVGTLIMTHKTRRVFTIYFFYLFSWNIIFQFVPAYLVETFDFTSSMIGDACALMGLFWILGTAVLYKIIHRNFSDKGFLITSLLLFGLGTLILPFIPNQYYFIVLIGVCTALAGIIWPICGGVMSDVAGPQMQGGVFGVGQSILSLSMMCAAFSGGLFFDVSREVPFYSATLFLCLAALIALIAQFPKAHNHES